MSALPSLFRNETGTWTEKKKNHQVNIVRLSAPRVHPGADRLELYDVEGYQLVAQKGNYKEGDLALFIQPDSIVPQTEPFKFIWEAYVGLDGTVPEKRRRITVRKFRKEWSEGLLMPIREFAELAGDNNAYAFEGNDVSDAIGVTHYDPDTALSTTGDNEIGPGKKKFSKWPRSAKGWFWFVLKRTGILRALGLNYGKNIDLGDREEGIALPVYDVEALKNHKSVLQDGEPVIVTEKIHGSNARFVFHNGHMYAGSRTQWKAEGSNCIWRKVLIAQPWIEEFCRAHEGWIVYGEVTPTQGGFSYGSTEPQLFVFDILQSDGTWIEKYEVLFTPGIKTVPAFYRGPYNYELVKQYVDGQTNVPGATGVKEGIVIYAENQRYVRGLGRVQLKIVSNTFLEKDSK